MRSDLRWLALIVAVSVAMALFRVSLVPILQCPDEDSHLDYALSIYSNNGLLRSAHPPQSGWNTHFRAVDYDWERISHIWTLHLSDATNMHAVRSMEVNKAPPDYGSPRFFARIDQTTPMTPAVAEGLTPKDNPWLVGAYPFGYYSVLAVVVWAFKALTNGGLVETFFALRAFSVVLLAGSIPLFYFLCREMKVSETSALSVTAVFASFPLTTTVSACIQPDNLSLFLSLLAWYLGARSLRSPGDAILVLLALTLGALAVTKIHFFVFVAFPVLAMLLARYRITVAAAALMLAPAVALYAIERWVSWGKFQILGDHVVKPGDFLLSTLGAIQNYWFGGGAFLSYWSTTYAWRHMPLSIKLVLYAATAVAFFAVITLLLRSAMRLLRLARSRPQRALGLALQNPPVVGYVLFTVFMVGLYAYTTNGFYAQGRHFYPFVPIGLLLVIVYAPRLVSSLIYREAVTRVLTGLLLAFCAFSFFHQTWATSNRYYVLDAPVLPDPFNPTSGLF